MTYRFEPAKPEEVPGVFSLFVRRVAWMKEKHICQWDQYYLDVYPLSYYQSQQEKGRLYVLKEKERIAGAVVLLSADERWPDGQSASAFYLHNLVTDPDVKGVGRELLREAEALALRQQKQFLRLDCSIYSVFLNHYYESAGFHLAGRCKEGPYEGNLREKALF